jgi:hypothetical protein
VIRMRDTNDTSGTQIEVLENLEAAVNYRKWCLSLVWDILGEEPFELGSGLGAYANEILHNSKSQIHRISLAEMDKRSLEILRNKFRADNRVQIIDTQNRIYDGYKNHSSFISWNVLEHIIDDVGALKFAREVCAPRAVVMIFVPAHPHLYSAFDSTVNHVRRYGRNELKQKASEAGLTDIKVNYINFAGYFYWLVIMKIFKQSPKDGLGLRILDRLAIPILMKIEEYVKPPFGQSLVLYARTP